VKTLWLVHKKSSRPVTRPGRIHRIVARAREREMQRWVKHFADGLTSKCLLRMEMDNMYGVLQ